MQGRTMSKKSARLYRAILVARKRQTWNDVAIAKQHGVSRQRVNQCVVAIRQAGVVLPDLRRSAQFNVREFVRHTAKKLGLTVKEV